jgi:hypothetical protein
MNGQSIATFFIRTKNLSRIIRTTFLRQKILVETQTTSSIDQAAALGVIVPENVPVIFRFLSTFLKTTFLKTTFAPELTYYRRV